MCVIWLTVLTQNTEQIKYKIYYYKDNKHLSIKSCSCSLYVFMYETEE